MAVVQDLIFNTMTGLLNWIRNGFHSNKAELKPLVLDEISSASILFKAITPEEMAGNTDRIKRIVDDFNALLSRELPGNRSYQLTLNEILSDFEREVVKKVFENAGWTFVTCYLGYTNSNTGYVNRLDGTQLRIYIK